MDAKAVGVQDVLVSNRVLAITQMPTSKTRQTLRVLGVLPPSDIDFANEWIDAYLRTVEKDPREIMNPATREMIEEGVLAVHGIRKRAGGGIR